jgi:hypothetical protein
MKLPYCKKPCSNCPFKKDTLEGWLGRDRAQQISDAKSFVCHKNTKLQCGGFLAFKQNTNGDADWLHVAKLLKIELKIDGSNVFDSQEEMLNRHDTARMFRVKRTKC